MFGQRPGWKDHSLSGVMIPNLARKNLDFTEQSTFGEEIFSPVKQLLASCAVS